jgi:hypothetical protein
MSGRGDVSCSASMCYQSMQVYSPPPKQRWFDVGRFWGCVGFFFTFFLTALGFTMTNGVMLAHLFFGLAWPFGSLSLWVFWNDIWHPRYRRRNLAWILSSLALGVLFVGVDFIARR